MDEPFGALASQRRLPPAELATSAERGERYRRIWSDLRDEAKVFE